MCCASSWEQTKRMDPRHPFNFDLRQAGLHLVNIDEFINEGGPGIESQVNKRHARRDGKFADFVHLYGQFDFSAFRQIARKIRSTLSQPMKPPGFISRPRSLPTIHSAMLIEILFAGGLLVITVVVHAVGLDVLLRAIMLSHALATTGCRFRRFVTV